jgi:ankyrin repeat protein
MTYLTRHEADWDQKTIDTPDKKGITLLMYVSAYGKEHTVKYLLSKGVNPAVVYTNKKYPPKLLHYPTPYLYHPNLTNLRSKGKKLNCQAQFFRKNPLVHAPISGKLQNNTYDSCASGCTPAESFRLIA